VENQALPLDIRLKQVADLHKDLAGEQNKKVVGSTLESLIRQTAVWPEYRQPEVRAAALLLRMDLCDWYSDADDHERALDVGISALVDAIDLNSTQFAAGEPVLRAFLCVADEMQHLRLGPTSAEMKGLSSAVQRILTCKPPFLYGRCPGSHPLKAVAFEQVSQGCSRCSAYLISDIKFYMCGRCSYYLCTPCAEVVALPASPSAIETLARRCQRECPAIKQRLAVQARADQERKQEAERERKELAKEQGPPRALHFWKSKTKSIGTLKAIAVAKLNRRPGTEATKEAIPKPTELDKKESQAEAEEEARGAMEALQNAYEMSPEAAEEWEEDEGQLFFNPTFTYHNLVRMKNTLPPSKPPTKWIEEMDADEKEHRRTAAEMGVSFLKFDQVRQVFESFDTDGSGQICREEAQAMLWQMMGVRDKYDMPESRFQRHWSTLDQDRSGAVTLTEFMTWWAKYATEVLPPHMHSKYCLSAVDEYVVESVSRRHAMTA